MYLYFSSYSSTAPISMLLCLNLDDQQGTLDLCSEEQPV